jgi:hypothetical protein
LTVKGQSQVYDSPGSPGAWQIGMEMYIGNSKPARLIVLNDNSGPIMVTESGACTSCTNNTKGLWSMHDSGFNTTDSVDWHFNRTWNYSDSNYSINGSFGTADVFWCVDCSSIPQSFVVLNEVPVLAVNNYTMTNTSWFPNQLQMYGSVGFGRVNTATN